MSHRESSAAAGQLGESRQAFMARVRAALDAPASADPIVAPPVPDEIARLHPAEETIAQRVDRLARNAAAVGMVVQRLPASELSRRVAALLEEAGAGRVLVGVGSLPQGLSLKDALRRKGLEVIDWTASPGMEAQFDAHAGITDVHAAIAESGTLVCSSDAGHARGLSLVPPLHIAIVRPEDVVADMLDYWRARRGTRPTDLPSSTSFITGPSKTADIEGVLITGVHGPGRVVVLIVE